MKSTQPIQLINLINIIFFGLFLLILGCVFVYMNPLKTRVPLFLDLSGSWQVCIPNTVDKPNLASCNTKSPINVPHYNSPNIDYKNYHWLIYEKEFKTPPQCLRQDSVCSFIVGEVGDSAEILLNGTLVGMTSEMAPKPIYSKNFPIDVNLPVSILKNGDQVNKITLLIYSMKIPQSGIRANPIGITNQNDANNFVRSKVLLTILFPILSAFLLILFGLFSFSLSASNREHKTKLVAYRFYCASYALFLISFSELPRQFLPIWLASHLHFIFRYLGDWSLFTLVAAFFMFDTKKMKIFHVFYLMAISTFIVSCLYCWLARFEIKDYIGASLPYMITKKIFFLKMLPMILGLIGSMFWKRKREKYLLVILFATLILMQANDILVFLEFYSNIYFVKFYPIAITVILGWILFKITMAAENERVEQLARGSANAELAKQVAHDIRSPLAALDVIVQDINHIPEDMRLILRNATSRIRDIANQLLQKNINHFFGTYSQSKELLFTLIEDVVSEKRILFRNKSNLEINTVFTDESYMLFSEIQPHEFKSIMSNLINNSVEAMMLQPNGKIEIRLFSFDSLIQVEIRDNGKGISPDVLNKIGQKGFSYGKDNLESGSGLGISHAVNLLQLWKGNLKIESELTKGTAVTLSLLKCLAPKWFINELPIQHNTQIIVLDDDSSIHSVLDKYFHNFYLQKTPLHFYSINDFEKWKYSSLEIEHSLFLIDYEFTGETTNGLNLIKHHNIEDKAILVTSHYEDKNIRSQCEAVGIRIIPKSMAAYLSTKKSNMSSLNIDREMVFSCAD
jgi:signal transduction histidine kinase